MTESRSPLPFMKMHGLGNDFVVLDLRDGSAPPAPALVRRIADRHFGIGFDQLATIAPSDEADARVTFYNADGSRAEACGNATRCVARWLMRESGKDRLTLRSDHALLLAEDAGGGLTRVNMGQPVLDWRRIPLAEDVDTLHLPLDGDAVATGMGNPHLTFFVPDLDAADPQAIGRAHEHHALYPQRANVEIVQVLSRDAIRAFIWERGVGPTESSGTGSCAAAVAACAHGGAARTVEVLASGGAQTVSWDEAGVRLTGWAEVLCDGVWVAEL